MSTNKFPRQQPQHKTVVESVDLAIELIRGIFEHVEQDRTYSRLLEVELARSLSSLQVARLVLRKDPTDDDIGQLAGLLLKRMGSAGLSPQEVEEMWSAITLQMKQAFPPGE